MIAGWASTETRDRSRDIVSAAVWRQPEKSLKHYRLNPVLLWQHKSDFPIGKVTRFFCVDRIGLFVEAEVYETPATVANIYPLIEKGGLVAFSIGFRDWQAKYSAVLDANLISDLELIELSIVSVPACPDALFGVDTLEARAKRTYEQVKAVGKNLRV